MKSLSSVAGSVGFLLLFFTAPVAYFTVNPLWPFIASLVLGVGAVAFWALRGGGRSSTWVRSAFFYSSSFGLTVAFVGLLIGLNFIAAKKAPSWDLTNKKVFSLSPQTEATLKGLKEPVRAIAFIPEPPEEVEDLFRRYEALNPAFTWRFLDPRRAPEQTARYGIREARPAAVLITGTDDKPKYNVISLERLMNPLLAEQELTNGIIKLETVGTQKLYFLLGHGELTLEPAAQTEEAIASSMAGLKRVLEDEGYAPRQLNLLQAGSIPDDASAVVLAAPRSAFSELERALLTNYLAQGGRLLVFLEPGGDLGLSALFAQFGVQAEPGIVADAKVNPDNPYLVYTPFLQEHEISAQLMAQQSNVFFPTTRAITRLGTGMLDGLVANPLVLTTPYAWVETSLGENPTRDEGERSGQLILALASRVATTNVNPRRTDEARFVIFGDADVLAGAFAAASNRDLVLNSIAWATLQMKRITIRPPDRDLSSVDLTSENLSNIRFFSLVVLPTLLLSIGLTIWNVRRSR
ncbi:MAG: GldG family protein [Archangium sp.]